MGVIKTLRRARLIAPLRPDRYLRMAAAMRREGMSATVGFAAAAAAVSGPPRAGRRNRHADVEAIPTSASTRSPAALQALPSGAPEQIGVMCRNHRGFVVALVAAGRIGADVLLLNTAFAGPALAEVVERER